MQTTFYFLLASVTGLFTVAYATCFVACFSDALKYKSAVLVCVSMIFAMFFFAGAAMCIAAINEAHT